MRSPFADDWRESLIEQFQLVMRAGDAKRRQALIELMRSEGFSQQELSDLYVAATMHMDTLPDDFVPDLDMIEHQRQIDEVPHPLECACPRCKH